MIKNYLRIAWRNLWRNKGFAALNIGGLAIGMAASMLIMLWVQNEVSFDRFHTKKDRLYMAGNQAIWNGEHTTWFATPKPLGPAMKASFPEVANISRYSDMGNILMAVDETKLKGRGVFVDSAFLRMFDLRLIQGDKHRALVNPTDIVITRSLAERLFGDVDVLGKTIRLDTAALATVSGVLEDMPGNTRFRQTEFFMPWTYMEKMGYADEYWGNFSVATYVELTPGVSVDDVNAKIRDTYSGKSNINEDVTLFLHALPDWWLYTKFVNGKMMGGRIDMVKAFSVIAVFILLIACINFMNLSTARSEKRAKEVGVRKVAGAYRGSLIGQFLSESILIALLGGILALFTVWLLLPVFGDLVDRRFTIDFVSPTFWVYFACFILFTGILAGSYPALFLSSFQPVKVLKGTFRKANGVLSPRKLLFVVQFTVAIALVICTFIVQRQVEFGRERDNGYDKDNLIYLFEEGTIAQNSALITQELLSRGVAESVTRTSSPLTEGWSNAGMDWQGKRPDDNTVFDRFSVDEHIVKTAGLTLVTGRDFDLSRYPTDSSAVILNELAVKAMGFDDPIGQVIRDNGRDWHVIGVVKDFIMRSPFEPIPPMVIEGAANEWFGIMHIKFNASLNTSEALRRTEAIIQRYNPDYPFEYRFVDEAYAQKFEETQRYGTLAGLFATVTIVVSCMGLFALAAYLAENRTKEIGIRKVLGASVSSIVSLLSKEFCYLVVIACLVAFPAAYWFIDRYFLIQYAYRTPVGWDLFVFAGLGAMLLALATVSGQAIRAAVANPVDSLRDE